MPKDEFDFDDPMELNGVALLTNEDTTEAMTECFIEEFILMGYNPKQLLALFRNPHYLGMNMVLQNRGEQFVRGKITEILARWGRPIQCPGSRSSRREEALSESEFQIPNSKADLSLLTLAAPEDLNDTCTDPLGNPIPKPNL